MELESLECRLLRYGFAARAYALTAELTLGLGCATLTIGCALLRVAGAL